MFTATQPSMAVWECHPVCHLDKDCSWRMGSHAPSKKNQESLYRSQTQTESTSSTHTECILVGAQIQLGSAWPICPGCSLCLDLVSLSAEHSPSSGSTQRGVTRWKTTTDIRSPAPVTFLRNGSENDKTGEKHQNMRLNWTQSRRRLCAIRGCTVKVINTVDISIQIHIKTPFCLNSHNTDICVILPVLRPFCFMIGMFFPTLLRGLDI